MGNENAVIFWGASKYAASVFEELFEEYRPAAFGDNDSTKHGLDYLGLPVLSFDEINSRYSDYRIYVTTYDVIRPDVINSLIEKGVDAGRIINYEKTMRYKSCRFLESNFRYNHDSITFCCSNFGKNLSPKVNHGCSYEDTMQRFMSSRDSTIEGLNSSLDAADANTNPCVGCCEVKEGVWPINRRIRLMTLGFPAVCNFECQYCSIQFNKFDEDANRIVNESLCFFRYLKDNGYIDKGTIIEIGSGEISVHPLRDKILSAIEDHPCWFYSNASAYNEKIAEILATKGSRIVSSIDAGTRETFKKSKGIDVFDKVCNNLIRYAQAGVVVLKYIFLPGVNDNVNEVEKLLEFCAKANIKYLDISRNLYDMSPLSEQTINEMARMASSAKTLGINVSLPSMYFTGSDDLDRIEKLLR